MAQGRAECKYPLSRAATMTTLHAHRRGRKEGYTLTGWSRMFEPNWEALTLDGDLGKTEYRVLLLCSVALGKDNCIQLSQRRLAEKLGISTQAVSRAMRMLVAKGLVLQAGHTYQLNSRLIARQELPELILLRREEAKRLRELEGPIQEVAV